MTAQPKNQQRTYLLQIVAALLGIGFSVYLLIQHTRLKSGIQDSASFCTIGRFADCDVVSASRYSEILGVPLASLGAIFFFVILLGLLSCPPKNTSFGKAQSKLALWCLLGLSFDLYLTLIQIFALNTICLMCVATYIFNLGILFWIVQMRPGDNWGARIKSLFAEKGFPHYRLNQLALLFLALVAFSASMYFAPSVIQSSSQHHSAMKQALEQYYAAWPTKEAKEIPIEEHDSSFGNPNSPIKIVEFSDFECPFCRKAAFTFHALLKGLENDVHFVFKHYPLDSSCNRSMTRQMHPMACRLAQLAYCANQKGVFWEYHDLIFFELGEGKLPSWERISDSLTPLLSREDISACLANPNAKSAIENDLEVGRQLGIRGTPTIFLNGKQISQIPITIETIRRLIELESQK